MPVPEPALTPWRKRNPLLFLKKSGLPVALLLEFVLAGIFFGLARLFRDFTAIFLIAALISSVYLWIGYTWKQRTALVAGLLIIMVVRSLVPRIAYPIEERVIGVPLETDGGFLMYGQMYVSLDPNGSGGYNQDLYNEYEQIKKENNYDYDAIHKQAMDVLWAKIAENPGKMPELFLKKGISAYSTEDGTIQWVFRLSLKEDAQTRLASWIDMAYNVSRLYYIFMIVLLMIAAVISRNRYIYFILMIVLGSVLAQMLIECQNRYKFCLLPLFTLPAAYVIDMIVSWQPDRGKFRLKRAS